MNIFRAVASVWAGFFNKRFWHIDGGGRRTTSLEDVSEDSALNHSAVWCATRLLCGTGASLPLPIYRGLNDEDRAKDREHPLYRLLNGRPNPEMTAYNFRSVMWQWQVNWGNAYAEIVREGNQPDAPILELWPIHPDRVIPKRDEDDQLYYEVRGETGSMVDLWPWQMLHIPSIITHDGIFGHGVIAHAREAIGAGIAAEKYGAHWFGGAAVPRAVIEHDEHWTPEARTAFREEWEQIYSGPDGHRVAVLQGGAKIKPLSLSAEDSQFLETRQFSVEEIARWYGVPPHLLQHLLRATFNNIEHLGISFVQYSLIPWLRIWEQCIWEKLLSEREQMDYFAEHNVDALLRGDFETRMRGYNVAITTGLANRNECRKKENWAPVPGGDTFLVQGAMVPLDENGKPESKFTEVGSRATVATDDTDEDTGEEQSSDTPEAVIDSLLKVISNDLGRFLTKESKAMLTYAKKPGEFVGLVDAFYAGHASMVGDDLTDSFAAATACGVLEFADPAGFAASWADSGKAMVLEACGTVPADGLTRAIQELTDSVAWRNRTQITRQKEHDHATASL